MKRKTRYDIWNETLQKENPLYYNYVKEKERIKTEMLHRQLNEKIIPIMTNSLAAALKEEFSKQLKD